MLIKYFLTYKNIAFLLIIISTTCTVSASTAAIQSEINFADINKYANFSNAAYQAQSKIQDANIFKNHTLTRYSHIPGFNISYFLATDDIAKTQIIAVRGTANIENAFVDAALELTTDKRTGIRLHNGFSQTAQAIYVEIKPLLKTNYVIDTTGHSLGGAVALILAMYLDTDHFNVGQIVTFGQPKITNVAGANHFQHLNIIRVVTPKDLVPLVPPFDPVDLNNLDIYWHPGKEVILLPESTYAVIEGVTSMMRAIKFTQEPLSENNLRHHQMSLYLEMIAKNIPSARLVPYENSFNLFNLFDGQKK
ncbi:MAG: lipase family protein [Gammaproteobacteria bacterium]|nr:lipase family protein [Gammaproteobacteria bacterium]